MKKSCLSVMLTFILTASTVFGDYLISENSWQKATLSHLFPAGIANPTWERTDGYCTSIFDDSTHRLLWRTGIGQNTTDACRLSPGYYSNTFLSWNSTTDTAYSADVFNWGGGSYGGGCLLPAFNTDTTPSPRHTYDGITYCKINHSVYLMDGANWKLTSDTSRSTAEARAMLTLDNNSTWRLSLSDMKWHRINNNIRLFWNGYAASPYESHLRAWSQGNKLLYVNSDGDKHAEMDLSAEQWINVSSASVKSPFSLYNARSCFDTKRQLWVFRNDTNICTYNPATRTYKRLRSCIISRSQAISYDSRRDVYVVVGLTSSDTRYFRYSDSSWVIPVINGITTLPTGYLAYDSLNDLHLLVYQNNTYRFRLDTTGASTSLESDMMRGNSGDQFSMQLTPNPFNPVVAIRIHGNGSKNGAIVYIHDAMGKLVYQTTALAGTVVWNGGALPSGTYSVTVVSNGRKATMKAVLLK